MNKRKSQLNRRSNNLKNKKKLGKNLFLNKPQRRYKLKGPQLYNNRKNKKRKKFQLPLRKNFLKKKYIKNPLNIKQQLAKINKILALIWKILSKNQKKYKFT